MFRNSRLVRLTALRLTSFGLPALATLGVAAMGCSSESKKSCPSDDGLWLFPNCDINEYEYVGPADRTNCITPDQKFIRPVCAESSVQQPYTGVNPGTSVQPGGPVNPAGVSPTVAPGVQPVAPVSPTTPGVNPVGPNPTDPVTPGTGPGVTPVNPNPTDPVSPGVNPGPVEPPPGPVDATNRTCPAYEGLIADFEEPGDNARSTVQSEGRIGLVDVNNDGSKTQLIEVLTEGTENCNNKVLHTSGSGFDVWGAGLETVFTGDWDEAEKGYVPSKYDASALGYVGISFRAKKGANHTNPVKMSLSIPGTREADYGGDGSCLGGEDGSDAGKVCWNHLGHFLMDDEELTTSWKTFTFCFEGDMHPTSLPNHLSPAQRAALGANLMTLGFEFNKPDDPSDSSKKEAAFDFYLDDVRLVKSGCQKPSFQSTDGAKHPFGTNSNIGTCMPADAASKTNHQIAEAYARWKRDYLRNDGSVFDPDQAEGAIVSEAIGYGMLITAAMGDKPAFDSIWGWAYPKMGGANPSQLLGWKNGGNGSATDADTDMAYALLMADVQWPGGAYGTAGNKIASLARQGGPVGVINSNNVLGAGNQYLNRLNPSYFSPGFYRAYEGDWSAVISATNTALQACQTDFGGLLPDWCTLEGKADGGASAQVQAPEVCTSGQACAAFDAARVPWRLGFDACTGGNSKSMLQTVMNKYLQHASTQNGARIDLLEAGWTKEGPTSSAVGNAAALIGPVGVGAMGIGNREVFNRAYLATLDIIERPEFYGTYFQSTVGLMALLMMSGNWPVVP